MAHSITRRLKPEEEEILRKREELATIRATLAERELELVDLRSQLAAFEARYVSRVGTLYAELDEWNARIAELRARLYPSASSTAQAETAREQARQTHEGARADNGDVPDFTPSPELKRAYREAAKQVHPDFAADAADRERRTRFMAAANRAYEAGDIESLRRILAEFQDAPETVPGDGIAAELIRIIRQISLAKKRVISIEQELAALRQSEIALLMADAEAKRQEGRDLLDELAAAVRREIDLAKTRHSSLAEQGSRPV